MESSFLNLSEFGITDTKFLKYNQTNQNLYLAGEFDRTILVNGNEKNSNGSLDLFLFKMNQTLSVLEVLTQGGEGTDRVTDFEINPDEISFYPVHSPIH